MLTKFGREYFQSPFFIWSVIFLGLTIFYANKTANMLLQSLLIDNLYLPIFIITQSATIIIAIIPIKKGLKDYHLLHNKSTRIVNEALIILTFVMFVPIFLIDQRIILATLWQSSIIDRLQYDTTIQAYLLYQFIGLPLIQYYNFYAIKSRLKKEGCETEDKLRNNLKSVIAGIVACIFIVILSWIVIDFLK